MKSFVFFLAFPLLCFGQNDQYEGSSLNRNSNLEWFSKDKPEKNDSIRKHSVKLAVALSAGLPGAGQIYNHIAMPKGKKKAFWKVPLIYAGLGATGYFLISNQKEVNMLKAEYTYMDQNNGAHPAGSQLTAYDQYGVLELYNQYQNWRDLSILGMGIVYVLQIVDAGVEAHFVSFDVSEDLSLSLEPALLQGRTPGLSLSLKFR